MKFLTIPARIIVVSLILLSFRFSSSHAQEAVLVNEMIDWSWQMPQVYGGNDFYWWHNTDFNPDIVNYGQMSATDWTSPYDYWNGTFYIRFEVIQQPTNNSFSIGFGLWQDQGRVGGWLETWAPIANLSGGAGCSVQKSIGSPANWWQMNTTPVDFTRPENFWRIGVMLWKGDSLCRPYAQGWSYTDTQCADPAGDAPNFFPMKAKITIVAVAAGHTFSGWSNYPSAGNRHPTPSYSIDFTNERTTTVIPSTDEYSINANMSGTVSGNGQYLALNPGHDVYLRKKASSGLLASTIQTLDVPARPATPTFAYSQANQRTSTTVSNQYEYSTSPDMSGAIAGTGTYVSFPLGTTMYFRRKATASAFGSLIQTLTAPPSPTPTYQIDYSNERTLTEVVPTDQYSYNQTDWFAGPDTFLILVPGQTVYFKRTATPAVIQTLTVPQRPVTPAFAIDFASETTTTAVTSEYQYSTQADMSAASNGAGQALILTPGTDLYIRKKATVSAFASLIQTLDVPVRPATPQVGINYEAESTTSISADLAYSSLSDMSGQAIGNGNTVPFPPASNLYIRKTATASSFGSAIQHLSGGARPATPQIQLNFETESTSEIPAGYIYSTQTDMSESSVGNGTSVPLAPGSTLYIQIPPTASSYKSGIQQLVAPARPAAPVVGIDFSFETTNVALSSGYLIADNTDMINANSGAGSKLPLTPGTNLYIRQKANATQYSSEILELIVPERPLLTVTLQSPVKVTNVPVTVDFSGTVTGFTPEDIKVTNGTVGSLTGTYSAVIIPAAEGIVRVSLASNVVNEGNFAAFSVSFTYQLPTGIDMAKTLTFKVYPTVAKDLLMVESPALSDAKYEIINNLGAVVSNGVISEGITAIPINKLVKGSYFIRLNSEETVQLFRFIKE